MLIEVGKRYVLMNGLSTTQMTGSGELEGVFSATFIDNDSKRHGGKWDRHGVAYTHTSEYDIEKEISELRNDVPTAVKPVVGQTFEMANLHYVKFLSEREDGCFIGRIIMQGLNDYNEVFSADGTVIQRPGYTLVRRAPDVVRQEAVVPLSESFDKTPEPQMRTFAGGATRNLDTNKLDYDGFFCPLVMKRFAEYMHSHRMQKDGTMRAADNWQTGIPYDVYIKSMFRHFMDARLLHKGQKPLSPEDGHEIDIEEALCAVLFNVQGYLHEVLKAKAKDNA